MSKRSASALASPTKHKKSKAGSSNQQGIQAFFSASSLKVKGNQGKAAAKVKLENVVIDLSLDDSDDGDNTARPASSGPEPEVVTHVPTLPSTSSLPTAATKKPASLAFSSANLVNSSNPATFPDLTVDPLGFSLSPCPWDSTSPTPYAFLVHALVALSGTRSRIAILNTLINTLRLLILYDARRSLLPTLYILSNSLGPSYEAVELSVGPSAIIKAIESVSGIPKSTLRTLSHKLGDPGDLAYSAKSSLRTLHPVPPLLIPSVFDQLVKISQLKGQSSTKFKQSIVEQMLVAARGEEVRYLVRTLSLNLRVGAVRTTILAALGRALALTSPTSSGDAVLKRSASLDEDEAKDVDKGGKGKGKGKIEEVDAEREALVQRMVEAEGLIKQVYVRHPHFGHIVDAVLEHGLEGLSDKVQLTVGTPLHPTLGSPTRSLDEIYERLGDSKFSAEFKYDGQRVQIHASRAVDSSEEVNVRLFSRHLEDMTQKYPDIVHMSKELITRSASLDSFILDAEVVAVDPHSGAIRTFQELSNRPRKDVSLEDVKVVVCVYAFDLMYINGEPLLDKSFRERRDLLRSSFPPLTSEDPFCARLAHVESVESESGRDVVEEFWERAIESRCEGLMIKLLDSGQVLEVDEVDEEPSVKPKKKEKVTKKEMGVEKEKELKKEKEVKKEIEKGTGKGKRKPLPATYEPDKRTSAWLKLKKDYVEGLGDSLDLVPIGGWYGIGRKAGWWSPILLGLWDPRIDKFVGVCKCMTGFSDAFYKGLNERYNEEQGTCSEVPFVDIDTNGGRLVSKVWFKPSEVWEIKGADITLSPVSQAAIGMVADDRGLSLRFPRFIRVRDDKGLTDASGPDFLAGLWRRQEGRGGGADDGELVDAELESE